ncbi:MAG: DoxX family protein [Xanthobacteraceae bacterium]
MNSLKQTASRLAPYVLSILRIMVALLLLQHGLSKIFGFPMNTSRPVMFALGWFAGWIEIVFGTLLLVGAWTRCVAFILSGELAFAYFIAHAPRAFFPIANGGEAAILFCFVFFYLAFAGGGAWSVDAARGKS